MTAVAGSRKTSPTEARHVPLTADRVVDRRSPRRASTRVVVAVALGLAVLSTVFTWTGSDAAKARDPLHRNVRFGAWVEGMTLEPARLDALGRKLRTDVAVASYYYGYGDIFPAAPELALATRAPQDVLRLLGHGSDEVHRVDPG